jgi:hypothetical protein
MSSQALHDVAALLRGVRSRLVAPSELLTPQGVLAVKASLVAWLVTPSDVVVEAAAGSGELGRDLRDALRLLVHEVDHHDLPVDVLATARRWLDELVHDEAALAST